MINYLIRRIFSMFLVIIVSSFVIYMILNLAPGGPLWELTQAGSSRESQVTQDDYKRLEKMLGLDKPPALRYVVWLVGDDWLDGGPRKGILRGEWGESWRVAVGMPVTDLILSRVGNTIILSGAALILSLLIAIPVGIISAVKQYSKPKDGHRYAEKRKHR